MKLFGLYRVLNKWPARAAPSKRATTPGVPTGDPVVVEVRNEVKGNNEFWAGRMPAQRQDLHNRLMFNHRETLFGVRRGR